MRAHASRAAGAGGALVSGTDQPGFARGVARIMRHLSAISVLLGLIGTWMIGYSVIDKFTGREYGDVGFGGKVARTPGYVAWADRNDRRTFRGLALVSIGGLLQLGVIYIPTRLRRNDPAARP